MIAAFVFIVLNLQQLPVDSTLADSSAQTNSDFLLRFLQDREAKTLIWDDSTHRWSSNLDWYEWMERTPGNLLSRQGTFGRLSNVRSSMSSNGNWYYEHFNVRNPVTDELHLEFVPINQVGQLSQTPTGEMRFTELWPLPLKPRTEFNYQQSKLGLRTLGVRFSTMLIPNTGLDVSVIGEDDVGAYSRAKVSGFTSRGNLWHQYQNWMFGLRWLHNVDRHFQSDGYVQNLQDGTQTPDMTFFNFNRFLMDPNEPAARSRARDSHQSLYAAYLPKSSGLLRHVSTALIRRNSAERFQNPDTASSYRVRSYEAQARLGLSLGSLDIDGSGSVATYARQGGLSLDIDQWQDLRLGAGASLYLMKSLQIRGWLNNRFRSDQGAGAELGASATLNLRKLELMGKISQASRLPSIQSLYWSSPSFSGNSALGNVNESSISASLRYRGKVFKPVLKLGYSLNDGVPALGLDSVMTSLDRFSERYASIETRLDYKHWEIWASADVQQFATNASAALERQYFDDQLRLLGRMGIWWKGYLLGKATYAKIGFFGLYSPLAFTTMAYVPEMHRWEFPLSPFQIPGYARLDFDVSARIRSLFFLMRVENMFDDIAQLGYFQTAHYPMPGRRFRIGLRWVLRN